MEFKFYKGDLTQEPLKTIHKSWLDSRKKRNEKLKVIFDTIPFYDAWFGSETSIWGIVCNDDNHALKEVKETKGYKVEVINGKTVIKPDKRYKSGKELDKKLTACWHILQESPDFSRYSLKELGLYTIVHKIDRAYFSVSGICNEFYLTKIPVRNAECDGDEFPEIPPFLTEIKESEFLALQGK
ncbi:MULTISPECIES: DUF5420 family protein [Glaesserella]|uniref:Uncharacterized protein n=1 Tax=Glaesserella australis TaxID=2094024 RepID=A0A328BVV8_9PAST|nr:MULTISPECIES: DUF5420 family protein [Glaesserella]AUI65186.1 hypothetical protein CJD39_00730 [Glaesserella sp. 15-184]RAL18458.1 hypothetical protein C5N92_07020 [Glaesserella australis]